MERTNDDATTTPPTNPSPTDTTNISNSSQIHHVLIIGAGPSALAVAARLREPTPSALYTDEEHRRFHWLNKHGGRSSVKDRRTGKVRTASTSQLPSGNDNNDSPDERSLLVLDAEGSSWLKRWHGLFAALRISHLRSPMFFHPDPSDRDALLAYAHSTTDDSTRARELVEIPGCVGREVSKHQKKKKKVRRGELCGKCGRQAMAPATVDERERRDYFAPSAGVFGGFVEDVVGRYGLGGEEVVREGRVCDVRYGVVGREGGEESEGKVFTVRTEDGNVHFARNVVVAVGAGNAPCVPKPFGECLVGGRHEAACHALAMRGEGALPEVLGRKVRAGKRTNVLVVGGGLTSAQIGDLVIKQGVARVWHLMRGGLKVKPFDIDLNWMSKFRNQEKAAFWMADDDYERAEMLKQARGGGSITPRFSKILHSHIATGHASLHTHTTVTSQTYNTATQTFHLTTSPPIPSLPPIDHIYLATGVQSDVTTLPFMRSMVSDYPLETYDGLPALTDDLAWKEDVPLFMAGKFAGLRLGPGAANLEGARAGAERIVLAVEKGEGLRGCEGKERRDSGFEEGAGEGSMERYGAGLGSRYEWLSLDE